MQVEKKLSIISLLIDAGVSLDERNKQGWSPLHVACLRSSESVAELLLKRGAKIDAKGHDNYTPLCIAAEKGAIELAKLLLERGANIDAKTTASEDGSEGYTPLRLAATY